ESGECGAGVDTGGAAGDRVAATASATRDGGDDDHLIAVGHRGAKAAGEADVLVVQIVRDEWIWVPALVDQTGTQAGVPRGDVGHDVAECGTRTLDGPETIRQP